MYIYSNHILVVCTMGVLGMDVSRFLHDDIYNMRVANNAISINIYK